LIDIYVDGDACPVRVYRVAARLRVRTSRQSADCSRPLAV